MKSEPMQNPHLEGEPFLWPAGPIGVLLIHGFTATTAEVRPLATVFHQKGYTVGGALLPGHRATPDQINRYRWQDWALTAEKAYAELLGRCEHVFVGGESTGALLALLLASRHPEIAGILAFAPALLLNRSRWQILLLYLAAPFVTAVPKSSRPSDPPSEMDRLWQGYTVNPVRGALELTRLQRHVRGRLALIEQPILIGQGVLDHTVHRSVPEIILAEVRSELKELHWFSRSHHCLILDEEREEVAELALSFMARVAGIQSSGQQHNPGMTSTSF